MSSARFTFGIGPVIADILGGNVRQFRCAALRTGSGLCLHACHRGSNMITMILEETPGDVAHWCTAARWCKAPNMPVSREMLDQGAAAAGRFRGRDQRRRDAIYRTFHLVL